MSEKRPYESGPIPTPVISEAWSIPPEKVRCTHREQKPGALTTHTIPCRAPDIVQVIPCACGSGDLCVRFHPPSFRCARHVVVDCEVPDA